MAIKPETEGIAAKSGRGLLRIPGRKLISRPNGRPLRMPGIGEEKKPVGERKLIRERPVPLRPPGLSKMQERRLEVHSTRLSQASGSLRALLDAANAAPEARPQLRRAVGMVRNNK